MSDIYSMLPDLPSFFDQTKKTPGSLTNEELQMRRKLAYAMASRNRPYPKTIGEGLTALGEAWGQRGRWQELDEAEAAQRARSAQTQKTLGGDVSYPTLDTGGDVAAPPVPQPPVVPPVPEGAPVIPQAAPPTAPPPGTVPGGAPAPVIPSAPSLTPRRTPAPDMRAGLAQSMMTAEKLAPEGLVPGGAPVVPGSVQLASLQPPNEPAPRSPVAAGTVPASVPSTLPTGAAPEEVPQAGAMSIDEWKARVARNESGGKADPYQAIGALSRRGDRPYGKYQVMGENVPKWTQEHLGRSMTPQEFLADPKAQEAVADGQGGKYISQFGPEGAAKAWFAGPNGMNDPHRKDTLGTHVAEYARRFNQPLVSRDQIAQSSLANGPSSSLASEEDARLADVTGQAAAAPRVQLASLGRNIPVTDAGAAAPTMGGVADAGIANAVADRRGQIAEAVAQQRVAQAGGGATAPVASPPPASQAPSAVPPSAAPLVPPQAIPKAPETPYEPPAPGPQPTLQSILDRNPAYKERMGQMRRIMADPRQTDADRAMAGKIYTDMETRANDAAKNQWTIWHEKTKGLEAHKAGKEKQDLELQAARGKAEDEAEARVLKHRFGGQDPQTALANLHKEKEPAEVAAKILNDNQLIIKAVNDGVIQGSLAGWRLNIEKLKGWALQNGYSSELAANTEIMRALGGSRIREALSQINPTGAASNVDTAIARQLSGADPAMEPKSFMALLHKSSGYNAKSVNDFEDKRDYYLSGTRMERAFGTVAGSTAPQSYVSRLLENKDDPAARAAYNERFGEGTAQLEIERAKRRSRRGQ